MHSLFNLLSALTLSVTLAGCIGTVNRTTLHRIVPTAMARGDIAETCAMGEGLAAVIESFRSRHKRPDQALAVIGVASAICAEKRSQQADISLALAKSPAARQPFHLPTITDLRIAKIRAHAEAARRFQRVWTDFNTLYPDHANTCPKLQIEEEPVYLFGLISGLLAVLHDGKGGREVNIPLDVVLQVGRASRCLDNDDWWNIPGALEASAWAAIDGSGPAEIDAWTTLEQLGADADNRGLRLATALYVAVAANSGRNPSVAAGLRHAADAVEQAPPPADWLLLERLAWLLLRHESDLIWIAANGHRTEDLGTLPSEAIPEDEMEDPFAEQDPFGSE